MRPLVRRNALGVPYAVPTNGQAPQENPVVVPPARRRNGARKRGEPLAKLTENDVRKARALYKAGWRITDLAYGFDVTTSTMCSIVHRKTWRHVTTEAQPAEQEL
jgi:hypothetical protein